MHQWVKFKKWNGRCKKCDKGFGLLGFGNRDFISHVCTWCKDAYHLNCFDAIARDEICTFGSLQQSIVPPSWIVKLPPAVSEKEGSQHRRKATVRRSGRKKNFDDKASVHFTIKPTSYGREQHLPLIVFINPKSGGKQGVKLLGTFQFLLNPRQVFDLSDGGPEFGLRMYARVNKLRILVCGGDGTIGWVLSKLDELKEEIDIPSPPIAVLPLGTGNDLARTLGWGGGYTDEPIEKIIRHVEEGPVVSMDRWSLEIKRNSAIPGFQYEQAMGCETAPLHVINNYFSIGADAAITLNFHESREANPAKFNNRLKNKMFYVNVSLTSLLCSHGNQMDGSLRCTS
jgi:diacylglycerol kinase (ATP)